MVAAGSLPKVLLVEGIDDKHVIKNLCSRHNISLPDLVTIACDTQGEDGSISGYTWILEDISQRVKQPGIQTIGVVIDADTDNHHRWVEVCNRFKREGYQNIPDVPMVDGFILDCPRKPRIGIWIMPDNQLNGMLEDFVIHLIPEGDGLDPLVREHLAQVEARGLNKYRTPLHQSKALIHSWLAYQENPGRPMGLAITCRYLGTDHPIAQNFINWLRSLYSI